MADELLLTANMSIRSYHDRPELTELARSRAIDEGVFNERESFFWDAVISNNTVDVYGTRMHESSLRNYARDFSEGRQFLFSHDYSQPIGMSLTGEYREKPEKTSYKGEGLQETVVSWFTMRDLKLNQSISSNDFIDAVRAGIKRYTSISFSSNNVRCSICDGPMYHGFWGTFGLECDHVPFVNYTKTDKEGSPILDEHGGAIVEMAYAWVHDGNAYEGSDVYLGATKGAAYEKARIAAEAGKLSPEQLMQAERGLRCSLPGKKLVIPVVGREEKNVADEKDETLVVEEEEEEVTVVEVPEETPDDVTVIEDEEEEESVEEEDDSRANTSGYSQLRSELSKQGIHLGSDPVEAIRVLAAKIIDQKEAIRSLKPLAAQGEAYGESLVSDAMKAGVRAKGATHYNSDAWQPRLLKMAKSGDVEGLRLLIEDWTKEGDRRLTSSDGKLGGRRTVEGDVTVSDKGSRIPGATPFTESPHLYD